MENIIIGKNEYRGKTTPIPYQGADRFSHMYMVGKTGVGKSTVFQNMCLQDIINNNGVCLIDPHGESIDWLLARIPKNRIEDVILFDPSDVEHPLGLNLLEAKDPRERDFLVAECIEIFYQLFDPERTGMIGPQFEHWLRNAAMTVMAGPEGGSIIEISKLFMDRRFELSKRKYLKEPMVLEFWTKQMARTSDFHKSEMLNYFVSKFGHFMNNTIMRNILGQHHSSFNFEQVLAHDKILLVNLSKGKIGDLNARMLGMIVIAKLEAAILKRAFLEPGKRLPFYLYVDEFQNLITDSFLSMLSESRKYALGIHLTNQYFAQLPQKLQDAIIGNVGTILGFEVGVDDAERLAREFEPFSKESFLNLPRFNFLIKLMISGKTSKAFSGISMPPMAAAVPAQAGKITTLCSLAYGSPKPLVEEQIKRYLR